MSSQLGNLTITSGSQAIFQAPSQGVKAILIGNESGLTVTVTMQSGGVQKTLYPSTIDWFAVNSGFTGNILINPQTILTNAGNFPASTLIFDAIGLYDSEDASMYPITLNRATNIGNTVNTTSTASNAIVNTTNAPGIQWLDIQPTDALAALITADTSGNLTWEGDNAGVLTTLLQLIAGASPAVKLAAAAVLTEALGNFQVDGTSTLTGDVTLTNSIILNTVNRFLKGKDFGGSTLHIAGYNASTAKQLDIADSTAGVVANIVNNTKVNGSLDATGTFSCDSGKIGSDGVGGLTAIGTLSVHGTSSLDHGAITTNGTGAVTAAGALTVNAASTLGDSTNKQGATVNGTLQANNDVHVSGSVFGTGGTLTIGDNLTLASGKVLTFEDGSHMKDIHAFTGTGNGTFSTSSPVTPTQIAFDPCTQSGSSQTIGGTLATSSVVTTGAGLAWNGTAIVHG